MHKQARASENCSEWKLPSGPSGSTEKILIQ